MKYIVKSEKTMGQAVLDLQEASTFGAALPLLTALVSPIPAVSAGSLVFLALLGAIGAKAGGAKILKATARVTFWGAMAMALAAGVGALFDVTA